MKYPNFLSKKYKKVEWTFEKIEICLFQLSRVKDKDKRLLLYYDHLSQVLVKNFYIGLYPPSTFMFSWCQLASALGEGSCLKFQTKTMKRRRKKKKRSNNPNRYNKMTYINNIKIKRTKRR